MSRVSEPDPDIAVLVNIQPVGRIGLEGQTVAGDNIVTNFKVNGGAVESD